MMDAFESFHFLRPYWLLLIPFMLVFLWLFFRRKIGSRSWEAVCDEELLPHILIGGTSRSRRIPVLMMGLSGLLVSLSLAGPVWEKLPQPVFNNESALVIALDLSLSMDSNDVTPSRLTRARFKIADILKQNEEGQIALLVYAGDAFTVTPLTDDMSTIESQLPALTTSIMPTQGNRTDKALDRAEALLKGAGHSSGNILLVSDELELTRVEMQVRSLAEQGYHISVLGIGTDHGAPVAMRDGSFLKDSRGEIVIPILREKPMRELANIGKGQYRRMTPDDTDIRALVHDMNQEHNVVEGGASEFETDVWREQGPWLLLLLLPLAALSFRRGYLLLVCLIALPFPENAQAFDWDSLWLRADQRARRELGAQRPEEAAELFKDPAWKAAAQYRAGQYEQSVESLAESEVINDVYNQGNALARLGKYEEAIANYEKVLALMPEHEDAKFNKELLEKELEKQEQEQQQQNQDNQNKDQQEEKRDQEEQADNNQEQQNEQERNDQQQENNDQQQSDQNQDNGKNEKQEPMNQDQQEETEQEPQDEDKSQQQSAQSPEEEQEQKEQQKMAQSAADEVDEEDQATEQWLRRIPDDPAGLLRRKFRYQYQQRENTQQGNDKKW